MIDKPSPANKKHIEVNKNITQTAQVKPPAQEHLSKTTENLTNLKDNAHKTVSETLNKLLGINITKQNTTYQNILSFANSPSKSINHPFNFALYIMNNYKPSLFSNNTAIFNKLLSAKIDISLLKGISHIMNYRTLLMFPEISSFLPVFTDKAKFTRNKFDGDIYKNIEQFISMLENLDDAELRNEALNIIIKLLSANNKYGSVYFFDDDKVDSVDFYSENESLFVSGKFSNLGTIDIIAKLSKDQTSANIFTETEEIKNALYALKDNIKDSKDKPVKINLYTISEYNHAVAEINSSCRSCLNIDTLV